MKNTDKMNMYTCTLQNRLGALDRLLGALTHRGFVPGEFTARLNADGVFLEVLFSFECEEEKTVEKLLKFLDNQVYVVEIRKLLRGKTENVMPLPVPVPVTISVPASPERRMSHV